MRLFLSSQNFGNHTETLLQLIGSRKKTVLINNAKDYLSPAERRQHSAEKKEEFLAIGLQFQEIDLRDYFGKSAELAKELEQDIGLIWLSGGNTFILRRALQYSGLDKLLPELLRQDAFVLGGSSAGSIVATPSLRGTEHGDDPHEVPDGYNDTVIWEGLNLVPFHIVPHYRSEWFGSESEAMAQYFKQHDMPYYALEDGQVVVVQNEKVGVLR